MFGGGQKFNEVLDLVELWRPKKEYGHERKFQNELQEFLDTELNEKDRGMMANDREDVVSKEHGSSKADIAVNGNIGIELKRDLTNSQTKKLRGQIEDYLDNYPFVIVCACGIKDKDGWRKLKNRYQNRIGMPGEVVFVWKKKKNYGTKPSRKQRNDGGIW